MPAQILPYFTPSRTKSPHPVLARIWRVLWVLAVCVMLTAMLAMSFVFGAVLVVAASYLVRTSRRGRGQKVIAYCQQATSANLPIAPMLAAAAIDEPPLTRKRLRKIAEQLEDGQPLGMALEIAAPEIGRDVARSIGAAERIGRLPHTLRRLWTEFAGRGRGTEQTRAIMKAYAIYALLALGVINIFCIVVVPKFKTIMADFHTPLPWSLQLVLEICRTLSLDELGLPLVLALIFLAFLLMFLPLATGLFTPRTRELIEASALEEIAWRVPVMGGLIRNRGLARVFDFVADAVANGYALDRALLEAAPAAGNRVLGRRIERWAAGVAGGQSVDQAARAARMPRQVVGFLAPVRNGDDLAAALHFLSGQCDYRASRSGALGQAIVITVSALLVGSFVALLGLSMFQSMAAINNAAVPYYYAGGL